MNPRTGSLRTRTTQLLQNAICGTGRRHGRNGHPPVWCGCHTRSLLASSLRAAIGATGRTATRRVMLSLRGSKPFPQGRPSRRSRRRFRRQRLRRHRSSYHHGRPCRRLRLRSRRRPRRRSRRRHRRSHRPHHNRSSRPLLLLSRGALLAKAASVVAAPAAVAPAAVVVAATAVAARRSRRRRDPCRQALSRSHRETRTEPPAVGKACRLTLSASAARLRSARQRKDAVSQPLRDQHKVNARRELHCGDSVAQVVQPNSCNQMVCGPFPLAALVRENRPPAQRSPMVIPPIIA